MIVDKEAVLEAFGKFADTTLFEITVNFKGNQVVISAATRVDGFDGSIMTDLAKNKIQ